jgi:hypothetical protein
MKKSARIAGIMIVIMIAFCSLPCFASCDTLRSDSVQTKTTQQSSAWLLNSQLHSAGLFLASGEISNWHPSFDMYFAYDRKTWGLQAFKSFDLVDHTTDINYAIVVVDRHFRIGKSIVFTPNIGFEFVQNNTLADKGSDVTVILNTAIKLTQNFALNYEAIFQNAVITSNHNLTSRLRMMLSGKYIDITGFIWYRNEMFNSSTYWSSGITVDCSGVKLSPNLNLTIAVSGLHMLSESEDTESFPKKNAVMFSIGCLFVK